MLKKRIIMMLTVAAVMVTVLAASALPAFAEPRSDASNPRLSDADQCFTACYAPVENMGGFSGRDYNGYTYMQQDKMRGSAIDFCLSACEGPTNPPKPGQPTFG